MNIYPVPHVPDSLWIVQKSPRYLPEFNTLLPEEQITLSIVRTLLPEVAETTGAHAANELIDMRQIIKERMSAS
ncbi:uncharacterized protein RSE6_14836 [Rhynchosporium secalis]|uniref:Uncharacterized protein n=1 Tax=Rhynchosporium secalis TaxID=38038 RepID=A0A1E1MW74_RHYSE|nr:uncharacterized protein RSE6_14836 [Rhynchosporium secalis]